MTSEERFKQARLKELSDKSFNKGIWQFSEFLSPAEQSMLPPHYLGYTDGGYPGAERRIAAFGSEELCGYTLSCPLSIINITPINKKYAENLSHRDFLGSVLSLGINRSLVGDILVKESEAYLFCLDSISDYICHELTSVRHTRVICSICSEIAEGFIAEPKDSNIIVTSLRCDAIISAVFHISRSEAKELFDCELVFCDGLVFRSPEKVPIEGSIISVRGKGRFRLNAVPGKTKKGRLIVSVSIW